jgi:hypothetical protein
MSSHEIHKSDLESDENILDLGEHLEELNTWATIVKNSLRYFENDIDLRLENNITIYLAIDFYDLLANVYPEQTIFISNDKNSEIRRAVAREALFSTYDCIYNPPIILLPPYLSETVDFFKISADRIIEMNNADYLPELKNHINDLLSRISEAANRDDLLNELERDALAIALVYSPYFMTGIKGFKKLLREKTSPYPKHIKNYYPLVMNIKDQCNPYYSIFKRLRPLKAIPNARDSKAVQYIEELNNSLDETGLVVLMSSAAVFNRFESEYNSNRLIKNKSVQMIRGIDAYYYAFLELYMILGKDTLDSTTDYNELKLSNNQLKLLKGNIKRHLDLLESISNWTDVFLFDIANGKLSGDYLIMAKDLIKFKKLIERQEQDTIISYIRELSTKDDLGHLSKNFGAKMVESLEDLRSDISSEDFSKLLEKRILELKSEQFGHEIWISSKSEGDLLGFDLSLISIRIGIISKKKFDDIKENNKILNDVLKRDDPIGDPIFLQISKKNFLLYDQDNLNYEVYLVEITPNNEYCISEVSLMNIHKFLLKTVSLVDVDKGVLERTPTMKLINTIIQYKNIIKYAYEKEISHTLNCL